MTILAVVIAEFLMYNQKPFDSMLHLPVILSLIVLVGLVVGLVDAAVAVNVVVAMDVLMMRNLRDVTVEAAGWATVKRNDPIRSPQKGA